MSLASSPCGLLALWNHKSKQIFSIHCLVMVFYSGNRKVNSTGPLTIKFQNSVSFTISIFMGDLFRFINFQTFEGLLKHIFSKIFFPNLFFSLFLLELNCILFSSNPSRFEISSPGIGLLRGHGKLCSLENYSLGRVRLRQMGSVRPRVGHFGLDAAETFGD